MPRASLRPHSAHHVSATLAAGVVFSLASAAAVGAEDWVFTPRASVGLIWTDNVRFQPKGLEESELISEIKPGFTFSKDGPRTQVEFDYDLQALWFADESDLNDIYHQARGTAMYALVPQSLFIEGYTRYEQQNVDPQGRIDFSNIGFTGNRTDAFIYGISPYHVGRWGSWGESLMRYQYQGVNYRNTDEGVGSLEDSTTQSVFASLGSPKERPGKSWRASGSHSVTEFDDAPDFQYDRVSMDIGVPAGPHTRAIASVGRESDVTVDRSGGGLDVTFWFVGFEWQPNDLNFFSARGGERYYGTAWEVHWTRYGSRGEVGLDYTEEPTTAGQLLGDGAVFQPGFRPGGVPALDTRVFLHKSWNGRASYELVRTTFAMRAYSGRYIYEDDDGGPERQHGAALNHEWRMAARSRLGTELHWRRFEGDISDYDQVDVSIRFTRELTRTLSSVFGVAHLRRDGDDDVGEFRVNRVFLYFTAQL